MQGLVSFPFAMSLQPFKFDTAYTHTHTHPFNGPFSGCPSCHPTNSVKALKGYIHTYVDNVYMIYSPDASIYTAAQL